MVSGFPKWGRFVGEQFGQNGQKLHEDYKINIWQNSVGHGGQANFSGSWGGGIPPVPPLGETLTIKGTMSLRVLLAQSLSHLVDYEKRKVGRK